MRLITWNINSVRLRIGLVRRLLEEQQPDILCLQETKTPDELFPRAEFETLGYRHMLVHGMKGYNGVAILSRLPFAAATTRSWCARTDCRHAVVELPGGTELHNIYVPAGGDIPDPDANPKFAHKLQFLDELTAWFAAERGAARPDDRGRRSQHRAARERCVVAQAVAERGQPHPDRGRPPRRAATGRRVCRRGPAFRAGGTAALYLVELSRRDWAASDRGRRLDHIWVTPPLVGALAAARVHRDSRGWDQASDHVPVMVDLRL